ncbi:MAG: tetratricopeptide repeat protein [Chitinophagales bacterium]
MKRILTILLFILTGLSSYAQEEAIDSLVYLGVQMFDKGYYEKAIEYYEQALEIDSNSALVFSEISMAYMYNQEYEKALEYSKKVLDMNGDYMLEAYITYGSCLDNAEQTEESIAIFNQAIEEGYSHYLLHYNLALNYYKLNDYESAEEQLVSSITLNPSHSSSHFLLGVTKYDQGEKAKSLLSLYYFLLMEPSTSRSKMAMEMLTEQFYGSVKLDEEDPNSINIFLNPNMDDDEFAAAEIMLAMLAATNTLEENKGRSDVDLFVENTASFFQTIEELKPKPKKAKGIYWEMYVPFFGELAGTNHVEAYAYYILQSVNQEANEWLDIHGAKVYALDAWLQGEE